MSFRRYPGPLWDPIGGATSLSRNTEVYYVRNSIKGVSGHISLFFAPDVVFRREFTRVLHHL